MTKTFKMTGLNGNIFVIVGAARRILKMYDKYDAAEQLAKDVQNAKSYDHALRIIMTTMEENGFEIS